MKASGTKIGLSVKANAGQPQVSPAAMPAAIHMSVLPYRNAAFARGHISRRIMTGHVHYAGRHLQTVTPRIVVGTSHHAAAGRNPSGTNSNSAWGG